MALLCLVALAVDQGAGLGVAGRTLPSEQRRLISGGAPVASAEE